MYVMYIYVMVACNVYMQGMYVMYVCNVRMQCICAMYVCNACNVTHVMRVIKCERNRATQLMLKNN